MLVTTTVTTPLPELLPLAESDEPEALLARSSTESLSRHRAQQQHRVEPFQTARAKQHQHQQAAPTSTSTATSTLNAMGPSDSAKMLHSDPSSTDLHALLRSSSSTARHGSVSTRRSPPPASVDAIVSSTPSTTKRTTRARKQLPNPDCIITPHRSLHSNLSHPPVPPSSRTPQTPSLKPTSSAPSSQLQIEHMLLLRQRDDLLRRSQHLQHLLHESESLISRQAKEIHVLRHAMSGHLPTSAQESPQMPPKQRSRQLLPDPLMPVVSNSGDSHSPTNNTPPAAIQIDADAHRTISDLLVTVATLRSDFTLAKERHAIELHAALNRDIRCTSCGRWIHTDPSTASLPHVSLPSSTTQQQQQQQQQQSPVSILKHKSASSKNSGSREVLPAHARDYRAASATPTRVSPTSTSVSASSPTRSQHSTTHSASRIAVDGQSRLDTTTVREQDRIVEIDMPSTILSQIKNRSGSIFVSNPAELGSKPTKPTDIASGLMVPGQPADTDALSDSEDMRQFSFMNDTFESGAFDSQSASIIGSLLDSSEMFDASIDDTTDALRSGGHGNRGSAGDVGVKGQRAIHRIYRSASKEIQAVDGRVLTNHDTAPTWNSDTEHAIRSPQPSLVPLSASQLKPDTFHKTNSSNTEQPRNTSSSHSKQVASMQHLTVVMPLPDPISSTPHLDRISPQPASPHKHDGQGVFDFEKARSMGSIIKLTSQSQPQLASQQQQQQQQQHTTSRRPVISTSGTLASHSLYLPSSHTQSSLAPNFTLAQSPVPTQSHVERSPEKAVLVRERDALEEELLLRYTQIRRMERDFAMELERRDRELEKLKLAVVVPGDRGRNEA